MDKFKIILLIGLGLIVLVVQSLLVNQIFDILNLSSDIGFLVGAILIIGQFVLFFTVYTWIIRKIAKKFSKTFNNK